MSRAWRAVPARDQNFNADKLQYLIARADARLAKHPFGTIKRWFGYTHFLLKGLAKVRCEWSLTTLVYNLKRVLNLVKLSRN